MFVPRIGTEVAIDYLHHDIDCPIITGQLYNGEDLPPFSAGHYSSVNHPGVLKGMHAQGLNNPSQYNQWQAKQLKSLEEGNAKLKRLLADSVMVVATLKEMLGKKLLTPSARRQAVNWAMTQEAYSQRRACPLVGVAPRVCRYRSS